MATGQYRKQNLLPSDVDVTTVLSSETLSTGSYADFTAEFDCRGFREVDFFIKVETINLMTAIQVQPEAGQTISGSVQYAKYLAEDIDGGVSTTDVYTIGLNDPPIQTTTPYKVTLPVEGRFIRLALKAVGGAGVVSVYAQRRV